MKLLKSSSILSLIAAAVIAASSVSFAQSKAGPGTTTAPAPLAAPGPNDPVATINGKPVRREDFTNALIQIGGLRLLDEFWSYAVTMEACTGAGIPTNKDGDIEKNIIDSAKELIIKKVTEGQKLEKPLTDADKDSIIVQLLQRQGVASPLQADWTIKTLAGLHWLAQRVPESITPTAEELANAQTVAFGDKAIVRVYASKDRTDAAKIYDELTNAKTPEQLAAIKAQAQQAVFAKEDKNLVAKYKEAVFAPGVTERSVTPVLMEVRAEGDKNPNPPAWLVFYVEKIEKAKKPDAVELAKFKDALADQKETMWRTNHLNRLKASSRVEIQDPILRMQAKQIEDMKAKAAAAADKGPASLPAPAPATAPK